MVFRDHFWWQPWPVASFTMKSIVKQIKFVINIFVVSSNRPVSEEVALFSHSVSKVGTPLLIRAMLS